MKNIIPFQIFERSIWDITYNEIVNSKFIELQENKGALNPYVSQYMAEEHDEFFDIDDDATGIIKTEDFQNWLKYELEFRFDKIKELFESLIENNKIKIYRALLVNDDYINKIKSGTIKHVGIFWTYDKESAEPHWGYNDKNKQNNVLYCAEIDQQHVDWNNTLRLNLEHEYLNEEKEIRLFRNTPLSLIKVYWNNSELNINNLNVVA
jgi:hypothetical protein